MKYELIESLNPPFAGARRVKALKAFGNIPKDFVGGWVGSWRA